MTGMARMAVFVVLGSALTVGALVVANYLATTAGQGKSLSLPAA